MKYCDSIFQTKRFKTREVMVGNVGVGGDNPVRIQSMTTSSTRDIEATIEQAIRLADAGCEIVRVTVQGMKEADSCEGIKNGLIQRGYNIPLVADIHFFPPAAMRVVDFVDKVRVNPGNFVDKRASFKTIEYDDESYAKEIERIDEKFSPLVEKCKKLNRSMRIGTNHGSLSDRIMNRYGDTPEGMVESALEFARVCIKYDYHEFMFSMKSSNPIVMVLAYRLLVSEMYKLGWDYPLHLGVTEAGLGEDGRIKSAMGIGSLLLDGIGDTIRVSLTEDPWYEIDPCQRLVDFARGYEGTGIDPFKETFRKFEKIQKRSVSLPRSLSLHRDGSVLVKLSEQDLQLPDLYKQLGCDVQLGKPKLKGASADSIILDKKPANKDLETVKRLKDIGVGLICREELEGASKLLTLAQAQQEAEKGKFKIHPSPDKPIVIEVNNEPETMWKVIQELKPAMIILKTEHNKLHYARHFFEWLQQNGLTMPVILNFPYSVSKDDFVIHSAAEYGSIFCDGLGDGICVETEFGVNFNRNFGFNVLQSARMRTFKTDFISCPSCGRTLFDLQDVTKRIRSRTAHLPGVKIAIMGCIVNGPGEMADADFGYVGSKPGKIDLYVGKECIEKDINFADADDRLIELIKKHGRWAEPEVSEATELLTIS